MDFATIHLYYLTIWGVIMEFVVYGIDFKHTVGEFCHRTARSQYFISCFKTDFLYECEGEMLEGKKGDLDLYVDAFPLIADPIKGRVPVSWKIIPLDTDDPVSYRFKEGSTEFWCGVQVRNHKYIRIWHTE